MNLRCGVFVLPLLGACAAGSGSDSPDPRYDVGRAISTEVLLDLTKPRAGYAFGVVNRAAGVGFKIPAEAGNLPIVYLGSFLWGQAADQLADVKYDDQPLKLKIQRFELHAEDCPQWTDLLRDFRSEIAAFLEYADHPFTVDKSATSIFVDGTSFMIQIAARDGIVIAWPDSSTNTLAHQAVYNLQVAVSKCTDGAVPETLVHDF